METLNFSKVIQLVYTEGKGTGVGSQALMRGRRLQAPGSPPWGKRSEVVIGS